MRFQTTETVQTPDSEIVLRALETTLPEISNDVVRDGSRITLRGLGPSPRTRNPRDITILYVSSDHATTVINADVNFQASALLGATSQDSVVRSKLNYVFDQVRSQLSLEARRASASELVPHSAVFAPAVAPYVAEPHFYPATAPADQGPVRQRFSGRKPDERPAPPMEPPVVTVFTQDEPARVEPVVEVVAELIAEEMVAAPESPGPAPVVESAPVAVDLPSEIKLVEPPPVVGNIEKVALASMSPVETAVPAPVEPAISRSEHPVLEFGSSQKAQRTHVPALIAAILALLLLFAVAAYYLLRPNPPDPSPTSLPVKTQPVNQGSVFLSSTSGRGLLPNGFAAGSSTIFDRYDQSNA